MSGRVLEVDTGYRPRAWAKAVHEALSTVRFAVLVVHRRGGKTVAAVNTLIDAALRFQGKDGRLAYVAPFRNQAKGIAWGYLKYYTAGIPGVTYSEGELEVQLPNGARIRIYGADNPDALRGYYFDGVVLDELAQMKPLVWEEVIRPALADRQGWALFIGTPKGVNIFSRLYYQAVANPEWYAKLLTWRETEAIPEEEIERLRQAMPDALFRQEFECDFGAGTGDSLVPMDLAREAAGRQLRADQFTFMPRILGVDVARFGDDRSAIIRRQGLATWRPKVGVGWDTQAHLDAITAEATAFNPQMIFVDVGYNPGVYDGLRRLRWPCLPVNFGGKAASTLYVNKRVEIWFTMRDWLLDGGAIPNDEDLIGDLCGPVYWFRDGSGQVVLESKDELKARGLKSPDLGDALACTFAAPVAAEALQRLPGFRPQVRGAGGDYNPFAGL